VTLLELSGVTGGYGPVTVLRGIDLRVDQGEVVVVLGANGAGKTTTLRAIIGEISTSGSITFEGAALPRTPQQVARAGIATVPQGRGTFGDLTVRDNLEVGAYLRKDRQSTAADVERWFDVFPRLRERHDQLAGSLSGGEQQMLAIARALMSRPRLLLLDEPSLGLAPIIVRQIFEVIREVNRSEGMTVFLVEQNAFHALKLAHRAYVMVNGVITMSGTGKELLADPRVQSAYLEGGRH
jgi:branched-chain amino acid transport system ATP-binding protein